MRRQPQQARSRRTLGRILEAAVRCFEARGYDETTTAEIARAAGVGVGTVYGYFPHKRAILLELVHETLEQIADRVVAGLDPAAWRGRESPREVVRALIDAVFHARTVNPGMQRILWERYFKDPEFRAAVDAISERVRGSIEVFLCAVREEGGLRDVDLSTAAFVVYHSMEWLASRVTLAESDAGRDAASRAAADMVARFLFEEER